MLITTAFASCTHESEDLNSLQGNHLDIQVGIQETTNSRAVITGQNLIDGSLVGVTVVDATGTAYQGQDYNNVCYTAATVDGKQQWTPDKDVTLSGEPATLYAYYPWTDGVDVSAIPVDMTENDQTDWMYATPVEGLNDANATAQVKLHHALANVKLTLYKDSYSGTGEVTAFSVKSDGAATGGTLNAKTGAFTATVNDGQTITRTVTYTLTDKASAAPFDCMVVPTGTNAAMTVTVTVDGHTYSSTTGAFTLAKATAYNLALKLTSTGLSVTSVSLTDWSETELSNADFKPVVSELTWNNLENGVYAVSTDGSPVVYSDADESCIAVALIATDAPTPQRIMIEKNETNNTVYDNKILFNWDSNWETNSVISSIKCYKEDFDNNGDILASMGIVPNSNGEYYELFEENEQTYKIYMINSDYTTWESPILKDYNGKYYTNQLMQISSTSKDIGYLIKKFNNATDGQNQGYSDWYIPSVAQASLIMMFYEEINNFLSKIGGMKFATEMLVENNYYTSNQFNNEFCFSFGLYTRAYQYIYKAEREVFTGGRVRFIRDIQ